MNRRSMLCGLGSICFGGAAVVGSGALSVAEMQRSAIVEVVSDADGYLQLKPIGGDYRSQADETIEFRFPAEDENADGLSPNAVHGFVGEIDHTEPGLLRIGNEGNEGTGSLWVFSEEVDDPDQPEVSLLEIVEQNDGYGVGNVLDGSTEASAIELDVGESRFVGIQVDTQGVPARQNEPYQATLRLRAETVLDSE